jgi:hypothetical protein
MADVMEFSESRRARVGSDDCLQLEFQGLLKTCVASPATGVPPFAGCDHISLAVRYVLV